MLLLFLQQVTPAPAPSLGLEEYGIVGFVVSTALLAAAYIGRAYMRQNERQAAQYQEQIKREVERTTIAVTALTKQAATNEDVKQALGEVARRLDSIERRMNGRTA